MTLSASFAGVHVASGPPTRRPLYRQLLRLATDRDGVRAVHLHLSRVGPTRLRDAILRIATHPLAALIDRHDALLCPLGNGDLVALCRHLPANDLERAVAWAEEFLDDYLRPSPAQGPSRQPFASWFDLADEADYQSLLAAAAGFAEGGSGRPDARPHSLDPDELSTIGAKLRVTPITDLIRQQTAVEVRAGGRGEALFRETYVSISDLRQRIAPRVDLLASRSLFRYLTEILDKQVLAALPDNGLAPGNAPLSLNLNLTSLASPEFHRFQQSQDGDPGRLVVEIQLTDVLGDIRAFVAARNALQARGHRVLIDGLTPLSAGFFDPSGLGADFVKICWDNDFETAASVDRRSDLRSLVDKIGRDKILLARAETEAALRWAIDLGITRFQGRFIDKLLATMTGSGR